MAKVKFDSSIVTGFQTFKKGLGFILIVASLSIGYSLLSFVVEIVEEGFNSSELQALESYIPEDPAFKTIKLNVQSPGGPLATVIEIPESFFLISFLFLGVLVIGIVIRFITAIFKGGLSLFKEDITYVLEMLRRELKYAENKGKLAQSNRSSSTTSKREFKL